MTELEMWNWILRKIQDRVMACQAQYPAEECQACHWIEVCGLIHDWWDKQAQSSTPG